MNAVQDTIYNFLDNASRVQAYVLPDDCEFFDISADTDLSKFESISVSYINIEKMVEADEAEVGLYLKGEHQYLIVDNA